ncbi:SDR family oxidoreductase [Paractinoplanes rishiriensis]|uniref:Nucleotide-diphosphate-sugar epimerase n=1 Tax=Paractinoplanes rishiriensis TaxID=1050105 RepID=A0A919JZ84_9ACTN|nr:NAD(P)H-binding protein [Actinoplanes rishiriensis]GIE96419.1 nucleotide-diphosphate-sugar epimerase [Actinoplanes rishiriensis]
MTVLVTGASGTLGSAVVPRLTKDGYQVRPTSRTARPGWVAADLRTGAGLTEAVRGVDAIVHLASSPGRPQKTDVEGTRLLLAAAAEAGVRRVVYVSIAGIDRVPYRYYQAKLDTEAVVRASGVPFTILRATQFHPFAEMLLSLLSKLGPLIIDPGWQLQPVAIEDVADRIADLLAVPPAGETTEFGGPEVLGGVEAAKSWLAARGSRRPVWAVRLPGKMSRGIRAGGLTSTAPETGTIAWRDYLAAKY